MKIIGRKKEIEELMRLYKSGKPELVAVYGRRRVGKTFLINTLFADKITFSHTGVSPDDLAKSGEKKMKLQLSAFYGSLLSQGMRPSKKPGSWIEAFTLLIEFLESKKNGQRQVVFIDELPWIDTIRSDFISSFGWFWNQWACKQNDLMLIVCGSANSWINGHLINAHGGLYNRLTYTLRLTSFSLKESLDYLANKNTKTSKYKVAIINMVLGGIPYYLEYYQENLSIEENIDNFFFKDNAKLRSEFNNLFSSTFADDKLTKKNSYCLSRTQQRIYEKRIVGSYRRIRWRSYIQMPGSA